MSDKLSVAFSEDVEDEVDRNPSLPGQHIKDILDLVKNGIITKSEGESLIEEYKRQSESNQAVRKQLLMRKQKILRRQDTNEKNLAKLVREGHLSEEEAAMILEDIREVEKHENLDSRAPLDNKDKHQRPARQSSLRGFKKYEKSSGSLESRTSRKKTRMKFTVALKTVSAAVGPSGNRSNSNEFEEGVASRKKRRFREVMKNYQAQEKNEKAETRTCNDFLDIPVMRRTRTNKIRCIALTCFFFISVYLLIMLPTSYSYINFDEVGIRIGRFSGAIIDEEKIYLPGRYAHGMFQDFVRYKKVILDAELTITGNAYSGNNLLPYQIGTHASNNFGPITARAKNGETYDIEVTLYYQILLDKLIGVHRYYGGYKQLNASIYDAVRYNTRNALSYKTLEYVLTNRQGVGSYLEANLRGVIEKKGLKFLGLKIGRVVMSSSINSRIFSKELNKKKVEKIREEGLLLNISIYTEHLEKIAIGKRESYSAVTNALIENDVATQQRKIDLIQAETERIIASTKKKLEANASLAYLDLLNEALNESIKYKTLDLQTALDVKRIESEVLKLRATNDKKKAVIFAPAVLFHDTNISNAIHDVETLKAETHVGIFNELRSSVGINRINLLHLEWIKYVMGDAVDSKKVKRLNTDVSCPTKFNLENL
eukprot:g8873.t1